MIFLLRIVDVSLLTVRTVLLVRGNRVLVPVIGFFARLALGLSAVRIISGHAAEDVAAAIRESGHGATEFPGMGWDGPVSLIYSIVRRRELPEVIRVVEETDPSAFVAMDDARTVRRGWTARSRRR